jgi:hypothetical protein
MSEAAQSATTNRTEAAPAEAPATSLPDAQSGGLKTLLIAAAGGLVTAALLVGIIALFPSGQPGTFGLQTVAMADLNDAAQGMDAAVARAAVDDARQCKTPLAFVTLSMTQGSATIRIRSGTYLSPPLILTEAPRRVGIPFPAPYPTGKGVLLIEGQTRGLNVWLSPGRHIETLNVSEPIPVVWTPKSPPC